MYTIIYIEYNHAGIGVPRGFRDAGAPGRLADGTARAASRARSPAGILAQYLRWLRLIVRSEKGHGAVSIMPAVLRVGAVNAFVQILRASCKTPNSRGFIACEEELGRTGAPCAVRNGGREQLQIVDLIRPLTAPAIHRGFLAYRKEKQGTGASDSGIFGATAQAKKAEALMSLRKKERGSWISCHRELFP